MSGLLSYTNQTTQGFWGMTILIVIFFVSFLSLKLYPTHKAFAAAGIITAIMSIFFRTLGLVNNLVLIVCILMAAVGVFWMWLEES